MRHKDQLCFLTRQVTTRVLDWKCDEMTFNQCPLRIRVNRSTARLSLGIHSGWKDSLTCILASPVAEVYSAVEQWLSGYEFHN